MPPPAASMLPAISARNRSCKKSDLRGRILFCNKYIVLYSYKNSYSRKLQLSLRFFNKLNAFGNSPAIGAQMKCANGSTSFNPSANASRATIVSMLYNDAGKPYYSNYTSYYDVPSGSWYSSAVSWGTANGLVTGYKGGFSPNSEVNRQDLAVMMYRYASMRGKDVTNTVDTGVKRYADAGSVSYYAKDAVCWAVNNGYLSGTTGNRLNPKGTATRAEVSAIMMRMNSNR